MTLWKYTNLLVIPSTYVFEDIIIYQMKITIEYLVDKRKYHIEQDYQDGQRMAKILQPLTDVRQSQNS